MVNDIILREVISTDIPIFFDQQKDYEANYMAAFTKKDPNDWEAFNLHWNKIISDDFVIIKTIIYSGKVAGYIASFIMKNEREIGYWIGKDFWGRGIATQALMEFVMLVDFRPIYARVAYDNKRSIKVLDNCGFRMTGEDKYFANARGEEIKEFIYKLSD